MGAPSHDTNHAWRVALPVNGRVGELIVLTPFGETVFDSDDPGYQSVWVCVRASDAARHIRAAWERVVFHGEGANERRAVAVG